MKKQKRMKTVVTMVALAVLLLVVVPVALALPFSDVPAGYWAFAAIDRISNLHITVGCGGGRFCPEQNVTRAQMAGFINNLTKAWNNTNEPYIFSVDNQNDGTTFSGDGIVARSFDRNGLEGISYGAAWADNGVWGETNSPASNEAAVYGLSTATATGVIGLSTGGRGGYFEGAAGQPDVVLGGGVDDDGNLWSDPAQTGSDIVLFSNDEVHVHLDENNDEDGNFNVYGGDGTAALNLSEAGELNLGSSVNLQVDDSLDGAVRAWNGNSASLWAISNHDVIADLDNNNDGNGCFVVHDSFNTWIWWSCEAKGPTSTGPSAMAVPTSSGLRETYATGSTELWLEDAGSASLAEGKATVQFDALYAEMVNLDAGYQVFLTPVSDQPVLLFVSSKTSASFEVQGVTLDGSPAAASFDYRIVAKRLGYEGVRLDTVERSQTVGATVDIPAEPSQPDEDTPTGPIIPIVTTGDEQR